MFSDDGLNARVINSTTFFNACIYISELGYSVISIQKSGNGFLLGRQDAYAMKIKMFNIEESQIEAHYVRPSL